MKHWMTGLAAMIVVSACTTETATTPASVSPAAQPAVAAAAQAGQSNMGTLLNAQRASNGLGALSPNALIAQSAQAHAADMVANGYLSHTGRNGSNSKTRLDAVGYRGCLVAENIAFGQSSAAEVVSGWMGSSGHRANILTGAMTEFGIGRSGNTWVLVLAKPC